MDDEDGVSLKLRLEGNMLEGREKEKRREQRERSE